MLTVPTLRKLARAVSPTCSHQPPMLETLEERRLLAVDIQFSGPTDVNEGSEAAYGLSFSGLPQGAAFSGWRIDWGDGSSAVTTGAQSPLLSHTYPDGESYVSLSAMLFYVDQFSIGHSYSESYGVHMNNVAPSLNVSADDSCEEGSAVNVYVSATDPGDDTISQWIIDWGDGTTSPIYAAAGGAVHVYPDGDGDFTINVYAYDEDGSYSAGPFSAFCGNVAPTLTIAASSSYVSEGTEISLAVSAWDPGDDTIQGWIIDWGDGTDTDTYYGSGSAFSHVYADAGASGNTYNISAQAWDEDGTYGGASAEVIVYNVAPSITLSDSDNGSLAVGETFWVYAEHTDPGDDTIYQWVIDWGDGNEETISGDPASFSHVYEIGGQFDVVATAFDEDGSFQAPIILAAPRVATAYRVSAAAVTMTRPPQNQQALSAAINVWAVDAAGVAMNPPSFSVAVLDLQNNPVPGASADKVENTQTGQFNFRIRINSKVAAGNYKVEVFSADGRPVTKAIVALTVV